MRVLPLDKGVHAREASGAFATGAIDVQAVLEPRLERGWQHRERHHLSVRMHQAAAAQRAPLLEVQELLHPRVLGEDPTSLGNCLEQDRDELWLLEGQQGIVQGALDEDLGGTHGIHLQARGVVGLMAHLHVRVLASRHAGVRDFVQGFPMGLAVQLERADQHREDVGEDADEPVVAIRPADLLALAIEAQDVGGGVPLVAGAKGAVVGDQRLLGGARARALHAVLHRLLDRAAGHVQRHLTRQAAHTQHPDLVQRGSLIGGQRVQG
mmetsp:Transcript_7975/g.22427  ORF Transcript_7975/g.22427 Transcript_7975/m.22427 type:complete len:267 (+) Transcript_7975:881-1681(+)